MAGPLLWASAAVAIAVISVYAVYLAQNPSSAGSLQKEGSFIPTIVPTLAGKEEQERSMTSVALLIHNLVNEERERRGIAALAWSEDLSAIAAAHSSDMAKKGYFDHVNLAGEDHRDRYEANGINCIKVFPDRTYDNGSENLMMGEGVSSWSDSRLAKYAVDAWLDSKEGHRENMLAPEWEEEGIGVALADDAFYVTQNFC